MTLNFEAEVNVPFDFDVEALAGEVINFTLEHEDFPYEPEVNLTLVDNEGIHAINKEFREIMMIILTRIPEKLCLEIL